MRHLNVSNVISNYSLGVMADSLFRSHKIAHEKYIPNDIYSSLPHCDHISSFSQA